MTTTPVTTDTFDTEVLAHSGAVLVDFWAPWCHPCRAVAPVLEEIASTYAGTLKVVSVNADDNMDLAVKWQVTSMPTLVFLVDGAEVARLVGARPRAVLVASVEKVLAEQAA